jgi:hypothetical protein
MPQAALRSINRRGLAAVGWPICHASLFAAAELTGPRSRIVHRPRPQDDPRQRRPDISKRTIFCPMTTCLAV